MNDDQNIEDDMKLSDEPSAHEAMDCKRAFTRMRVPAPDVDDAWQKFSADTDTQPKMKKSKSKRSLFIGFVTGVAASVVIFFGIYQMFIASLLPQPVQVFNAEESGSDVLLSYSSGQSYNLSNANTAATGVLLTQGVKANKDSLVYMQAKSNVQPKLLTVSTPRGKDYHIVLPDGTNVWLNADTKLVFPEHFSGARREVQLDGEAYFEVTEDKEHPFVVNNKLFATIVLGTKFNMKTYNQDDANVVLIEGRVQVESTKTGATQTILPGQKAHLTPAGQFDVQQVDTYAFVQWKEGYFYFNDAPLVEIMRELGRWYNVDIIIENSRMMYTRLHFVAERGQGIAEALQNLNAIDDVHAVIKNNTVVVK
ncbi:FecR family protein [Bacteroides reticulotermitis]|uniref:FecR family protein n=1 Tax=Bacteroides reticulotermitis TaxID=1133319 RepID=UPI003A8BE193